MQPTKPTGITWIWRQIGFSLPTDWEMLQFSAEYPKGRCAFADRYRFRAEMSWSLVKGEPDYDRMISDYTSRLEQEKKLIGTDRLKKAGWHGFSGTMPEGQTSRFGQYLASIGCLIEWVFLWPEERDPAIEQAVLASCRAETANQDGLQPWRAFGLDLRLPAAAAFSGCTAQPARAEFTFTDPRCGNEWTFTRLGMVDVWLKTDLETWLTRLVRKENVTPRLQRRRHGGVEAVYAEGEWTPKGIHLRKGTLEALAWRDPMDGRLYSGIKRIRKPNVSMQLPIETLMVAAPDFSPILASRPGGAS